MRNENIYSYNVTIFQFAYRFLDPFIWILTGGRTLASHWKSHDLSLKGYNTIQYSVKELYDISEFHKVRNNNYRNEWFQNFYVSTIILFTWPITFHRRSTKRDSKEIKLEIEISMLFPDFTRKKLKCPYTQSPELSIIIKWVGWIISWDECTWVCLCSTILYRCMYMFTIFTICIYTTFTSYELLYRMTFTLSWDSKVAELIMM